MKTLYKSEIQLFFYAKQFFYAMTYTHHQIGDDILDFVAKMLFLEYIFPIFVLGLFFDLRLFFFGKGETNIANGGKIVCLEGRE